MIVLTNDVFALDHFGFLNIFIIADNVLIVGEKMSGHKIITIAMKRSAPFDFI